MHGRLFVAATVLMLSTVSPISAQDTASTSTWAGYYVGIDAMDGSIDHLSITPESGGTYKIRMTSTRLGHCQEGVGAGWITATARRVADDLVRENVVFQCAGSDDGGSLPDGMYVRDAITGILTIEASGGRMNHYHPMGAD